MDVTMRPGPLSVAPERMEELWGTVEEEEAEGGEEEEDEDNAGVVVADVGLLSTDSQPQVEGGEAAVDETEGTVVEGNAAVEVPSPVLVAVHVNSLTKAGLYRLLPRTGRCWMVL